MTVSSRGAPESVRLLRTIHRTNRAWSPLQTLQVQTLRAQFLQCLLVCIILSLLIAACTVDERRSGVPSEAQDVINQITEDIAAGHFDKIYNDAAEEWQSAATPEQSRAGLERIRDRLGKVEGRTLYTGRERQGASGEISGRSLVVSYQTTFARGTGMETFTLVEREGRWLLARYFVSSDALK